MRLRLLRAAASALLVASAASAQTAPPAATDLDKAQAVVGNWVYHANPGGSAADFIDGSGVARLIVRCTRATRVINIVRGAVRAAAPSLVVTTTFGARSLAASFASGNLAGAVAANDPLLDEIAFSRGKWAIGNSGDGAVVVPSWADVARVIEDCRS